MFQHSTLEARMSVIKEIQPLFHYYARFLAKVMEKQIHRWMFVHIAKQLRRTINSSESTLLAIGEDKKGDQKYSHFKRGFHYVSVS